MDSDTLIKLIAILMGLTLLVGGVLVTRDTIRGRGRWGVNVKPVHCPECGEPAPTVRDARNWRQTLWGGCTCPGCGLEYDKWGRPVDADDEEAQRRRSDP